MKQINSQKTQIKLRNKFIKLGVKMIGPETIFFSEDTKIGKNVTINPYVVIDSKVKIGNNVTINSFSHLENCKIENKVNIGPYARIRPADTSNPIMLKTATNPDETVNPVIRARPIPVFSLRASASSVPRK